MKKTALFFIGSLTWLYTSAQGPVTNQPANNGQNNPRFWSRAGNTLNNGQNNVLGFQANNNSTIWFQTNGFNRMFMDNGGGGNNLGRIGMGNNLPNNFNPRARLHLHQNGGVVGTRYTTNFTGTGNLDGFYIGWANGTNPLAFLTNFELNSPIAFYTEGGPGGATERLRITTFNTNGFIGMGNTLNMAPLSQLHVNTRGAFGNNQNQMGELFRTEGDANLVNAWRMLSGTAGGASTQKAVIFSGPATMTQTGLANLPAVNNAPQNHLVIESTQGDVAFHTVGAVPNGNPVESMRITRYTFADQFGNARTRSRVIIPTPPPAFGLAPVVPLAALHIGNQANFNGAGHRSWMDYGAYMNDGSDNMYVGLKRSEALTNGNPNGNVNDAVIAWGDDTGGGGGADVFRMIFTGSFNGGAAGTGGSQDGLETMRVLPNGNVGIGDFSWGGPNGPNSPGGAAPITHKLDIDGNLRIREVDEDPNLNMVLVQDDDGCVFWRDAAGLGGAVLANNGCSIDLTNPNQVQLGQGAITIPGDIAQLVDDRHIPMYGHSVTFTDNQAGFVLGGDRVQVGTWQNPSLQVQNSKLTAVNSEASGERFRIGGHFSTSTDESVYFPGQSSIQEFSPYNFGTQLPTNALFGSVSIASDSDPNGPDRRIGSSSGAYGESQFNNVGASGKAFGSLTANTGVGAMAGSNANNTTNTGVEAVAITDAAIGGTQNIGVSASATGGDDTNFGVLGLAQNGNATNVGVVGRANGSVVNIGVAGEIQVPDGVLNIGVSGSAPVGTGNWAAYFNGQGFITNLPWVGSDEKLKTDIKELENASDLLSKLSSKTYSFRTDEFPSLNLSDRKQYGLIAQELEQVLPELVREVHHPAKYNDEGELLHEAVDFKSVQYGTLIPILIAGHNEQQAYIDELEARLEKLESALTMNDSEASNNIGQEVTLENIESIVLNQNVPNPFAEQTVITYHLPTSVSKAQILFHNVEGKLIKAVDLNQRGEGQLSVFASDLSTGLYTYTLVADGEIIATKRMVKQ